MRNLPLIAGALFCEPWQLLPEVYAEFTRQFQQVLEHGSLLDSMAADDPVGNKWRNRWTDEEGFYHPQIEKGHGIAYRDCSGVIGKHLSNFEMSCYGGVDLAILEQQMANVRDDEEIHTLILNFNSPGGRAQGVESAALAIRSVADAGKRVIGYTDTCCASAAYFLAAACDELIAHPDAIVGSISTICVGVDSSKAWEMDGYKLELVATGKLKAVGQPGKAWTEEERQFLRDRAKVVDDVFKGFVRQHRGLSDDAMEGAHWYARAAPEGVIDGFAGKIEEVIQAAVRAA